MPNGWTFCTRNLSCADSPKKLAKAIRNALIPHSPFPLSVGHGQHDRVPGANRSARKCRDAPTPFWKTKF